MFILLKNCMYLNLSLKIKIRYYILHDYMHRGFYYSVKKLHYIRLGVMINLGLVNLVLT